MITNWIKVTDDEGTHLINPANLVRVLLKDKGSVVQLYFSGNSPYQIQCLTNEAAVAQYRLIEDMVRGSKGAE